MKDFVVVYENLASDRFFLVEFPRIESRDPMFMELQEAMDRRNMIIPALRKKAFIVKAR